jgi:hypothetical protein
MFAVQLHTADKAVFEGIMLALEGELLRDLRSSGRGLDGGSACIEMQQSNLPSGG